MCFYSLNELIDRSLGQLDREVVSGMGVQVLSEMLPYWREGSISSLGFTHDNLD